MDTIVSRSVTMSLENFDDIVVKYKAVLDKYNVKYEARPDKDNPNHTELEIQFGTDEDLVLYGAYYAEARTGNPVPSKAFQYLKKSTDWMKIFHSRLDQQIGAPGRDYALAKELYDAGLSPEDAIEKYIELKKRS